MKIWLDVHVETLRNTSFDVRLKIKSLSVAGFTSVQNQLLLDSLPVELERALLTQAINGPKDRRQRTRRKIPANLAIFDERVYNYYFDMLGRSVVDKRCNADRRKT